MASLEISTPPGSWSLAAAAAAAGEDHQDTPTATLSVDTTHPSNADENHVGEPAEFQAKESKEIVKGKGKYQKKHGVMSLPAEIRETYAFRSSTGLSTSFH